MAKQNTMKKQLPNEVTCRCPRLPTIVYFQLENIKDYKVSGQLLQTPTLPQEQSGRTASHG